ncbi:MAG: FtsW/RodA/SpoVE family cell cycle protein [Planctomycetota bacterium]|jgi:cell division protein FtsW
MPRAGEIVGLVVFALLCIGVVMVSSAGMRVGQDDGVTMSSILLSRPAMYAMLALACMVLVTLPFVQQAARWMLENLACGHRGLIAGVGLACIFCLLPYIPGLGREANGAQRWVSIGALGFQPSELVKWLMPLLIAGYVVSMGERIQRFWKGLMPALLGLGLPAIVIAKEDLGTAVLIVCVGVLILVAGGARIWQMATLVPIGCAAIAGAIALEPYRIRRLTAFLDPYADPEGSGYHMIQSMVAVANGEGYGRGLGFGLQKFGYLPEDRTDFLFAIISEELGIAGVALVLGLYLMLLWIGWSIVRRHQQVAMRLYGFGILATLGIQGVITLFAVTGLGPTKGIALPLLSAGGTGWVLTAASLGMLIAMDRDQAESARVGTSQRDPLEDTPEELPRAHPIAT